MAIDIGLLYISWKCPGGHFWPTAGPRLPRTTYNRNVWATGHWRGVGIGLLYIGLEWGPKGVRLVTTRHPRRHLRGYRGTSLIKNCPLPKDFRWALDIGQL